jgi:quercetin dioxygenase-like cupin family protein
MVHAERATAVLHRTRTPAETVRPGLSRRIIRTGQLMTVTIDFEDGPWADADPFHSHPHEQTCYVAEGEVLFLSEGQETRKLSAGDLFAVPPDIPHSIQLLSRTARLVDTFHPVREDFIAQAPDADSRK